MCDLGYLTVKFCMPERIRLVQLEMASHEYPLPPSVGPWMGGMATVTLIEPCLWRRCLYKSSLKLETITSGGNGKASGCCLGAELGTPRWGSTRGWREGRVRSSHGGQLLLNSQVVL